MLDTLPVTSSTDVGQSTDGGEHMIEMNADGATAEVIAWENWWTMKEETNMRLFEAIGNRNE